MKNFKKVLALVLVVATVLSFALVAGAVTVEYTDARSISHQAAVDILSAVGVINGYENGSFKPGSSVTRAEMAKILAFVLNGGKDVGDVYAGACNFTDAKDHWAKGYIGYCVSAGLINGKNETTFDPEGKVTGYEVSKMLLCALGYNAQLNGLTGDKWNTNAHALAIQVKLLEDLESYTPAEPMTRDDTCQMILNTLETTMVFTEGSTMSVGGISITDGVKNTKLKNNYSSYYEAGEEYLQLVEDCFPSLKRIAAAHDELGRPAEAWKLGGQVLGVYGSNSPILAQSTSITAKSIMGKLDGDLPERVEVFYNGKEAGTATYTDLANILAANAALSSKIPAESWNAARTSPSALCNIIRSLTTSDDYTLLKKAMSSSACSDLSKASAAVLMQLYRNHTGGLKYFHSSGVEVSLADTAVRCEVFYDEQSSTLTVASATYYLGKVLSVREDVVDAAGNVTVPGHAIIQPFNDADTYLPNGFAPLKTAETTVANGGQNAPVLLSDIDAGDGTVSVGSLVAYTFGEDRLQSGQNNVVLDAILLSKATETLNQVRTSNGETRFNVRIYGTSKNQYRHALGAKNNIADHQIGSTYDVYYTTFGSANIYFYTEGASADYVYVYAATKDINAIVDTYLAKLVKSNGTVEVVQTDKNYGAGGGQSLIGAVVTTSKDSQGRTILTAVPNSVASGNDSNKVTLTNSNSTVSFTTGYNSPVTETADTKTKFIISQRDTMGQEYFTVYNGIDKVPTLSLAAQNSYFAYVRDPNTNNLHTVYLMDAVGLSSAEQEGVLVKTAEDINHTGEFGSYYELQAIVNGQLTTLKITDTAYASLSNGLTLFNAYSLDGNGLVTGITKVAGTKINSFLPLQSGNITLNGAAMVAHDNVLVYTYSLTTKKLEISSVANLFELNTDVYDSYYTLHDVNLYPTQPLAGIFAIID